MSYLYVQWAMPAGKVAGWEKVNLADWAKQARRDDPTPIGGRSRPPLDGAKGYVNAMCFKGLTIRADHYSVRLNPDGSPTLIWWTDTDLGARGARATEATYHLDGRQRFIVYVGDPDYVAGKRIRSGEYKHYSQFTPPTAAWHGYEMSEALYQAHVDLMKAERHGIGEWP